MPIQFWNQRRTTADVLAVFAPNDDVLTRGEIAKRLGRTKTSGVVNLIEECVQEGLLERSEEALINGVLVYLYRRP
jgi:predicted transcriptional regulator